MRGRRPEHTLSSETPEHGHGTDTACQAVSTASSGVSNAKAAVENRQRRGCRNQLRGTGQRCPTQKRYRRSWQRHKERTTERGDWHFDRGCLIALPSNMARRVAQTRRFGIHGCPVHAIAIRHFCHSRYCNRVRQQGRPYWARISRHSHLGEKHRANHGNTDQSLQCLSQSHIVSVELYRLLA